MEIAHLHDVMQDMPIVVDKLNDSLPILPNNFNEFVIKAAEPVDFNFVLEDADENNDWNNDFLKEKQGQKRRGRKKK